MRNSRASSIVEFGPALCIGLIVIFALYALLTLLVGYITLNFTVQSAVREAGSAQTRSQALLNVQNRGTSILSGPFGSFGGISPPDATGLTLLVVRKKDSGGNTEIISGNLSDIDTGKYSYTYLVHGKYTLKPIFYPGSVQIEAESSCSVEHPTGLAL